MTKAKAAASADEPPAKRSKKTARAWNTNGSVHIKEFGSCGSSKVAAFDMDGTLIKTRSGKAFAQSQDDWQLWAPEVASKLQTLHGQGYKIVIITNQVGVAKGKVKLVDIEAKIDAIQLELKTPLLAMILTGDDIFRKPLPGSWDLLASQYNYGFKIDKAKSFFCGDAAGRAPPATKTKDFSDGDLKFALNVGVPFMTPEEYFLGKDQHYETEHFRFDPRKLGLVPQAFPVPATKQQTVVVIVGPPGSGKSNAATKKFSSSVRVNQDILKTKERCYKACKEAIDAGKSAAIDNQNKAPADRAPYIAMAKAAGVKVIAIYYDVPKEMCFHLNSYRMLSKTSDLHRQERVPSIVIHGYFKNKVEPSKKEGFDQVYRLGLEHFEIAAESDVKLLRSFL